MATVAKAVKQIVYYTIKSDNEMLAYWQLVGIKNDVEALAEFNRLIGNERQNPNWPYRLYKHTITDCVEVIAE